MQKKHTRYWLATALAVLVVGMQGSSQALVSIATTTQAATTQSDHASKDSSIRGKITIDTGWTLQKPDLARTVVYLASTPVLDAAPAASTPAIMAQHDKAFEPNFIAVSRGTTVEFPNWDHFAHNVFSRSAAAPAFDLSRYSYGQSKSRVFEKAGVVQMFCNIHPDMRAMVFVAPNPYFARTDAEGRFEIHSVPAGQYELVTWNERCKEIRQSITVGGTTAAEISVTLQESRDEIMANNPPGAHNKYSTERGLFIKHENLGLPVVQDVHPAPTPPPDHNP